MDNTEDDAKYNPNSYGSNRQKVPFRGGSYPRPVGSQYDEEAEEDEEDEELEEQEEEGEEDEEEEPEEENDLNNNNTNNNGASNGFPSSARKDIAVDDDDHDDDHDDYDDESDDDDDEDRNEDHGKRRGYNGRNEGVSLERHPKKRKLKSLISSYEFAPRVSAPLPPPAPLKGRNSFSGRNSLTDWTERETFVLLESWGDRFLQRGKKSLRTEEWQEVADKVSEVSKVVRTDTQCRNRLDTLKKKYKKEKLGGANSKWVYFKKMDLLLSMSTSSPAQQQSGPTGAGAGLSCGVDSGEYVFMNPRVYLNRANGLDEMRDSPGNSESDEEEDGSDGLPPKKRKYDKNITDDGSSGSSPSLSSFRLIANSIHKFSAIYEKIEASKRQQMMEIEKMRMDFQRELEMQKRQIMERAHAEIAKIRRGGNDDDDDDDDDDEDVNVSVENGSG